MRRGLRLALCAYAFTSTLSISGANMSWPWLVLLLPMLALPRGLKPRWTPILWPALAYCLVAAAAAWGGVEPARSLQAVVADLHKLLLLFLFGWAFFLEPTPGALGWMGGGFLTAGGVGILQATIYRLDPRFPLPFLSAPRAHAFFHPVTYGEQMTFAFLAGVSALLLPPATIGLPLRRRWILLFTCVAAAALILSQTRGAWLAAAAGLAVFLPLRPMEMKRALLPAGALAALLFAPVHPLGRALFARAESAVELHHPANAGRRELWKTAWGMARAHPLLGVGPNNFRNTFRTYHPGPIEGAPTWGDAHNQYLDSLAERGLVGLASLLVFLGALLLLAWRACQKSPNTLTLWSLSSSAALVVMGLTETAFQSAMAWMPFLFLWAFAEASSAREKKP